MARVRKANPGKRGPTNSLAGKSVLELTPKQARTFFLNPECYFRLDVPQYFDFGRVLRAVDQLLRRKPLASYKLKPVNFTDVNYTIYSNKDGRYAWRPFELIHPVLYVDLVHLITSPEAWTSIRARFAEFALERRIRCLSIPVWSPRSRKYHSVQVFHWWQRVEQASIELALDYNHVYHADITDCYASVYTHSVAWAVHGKTIAKGNRNDQRLVGNAIDKCIRNMRNGQTNGVPQGSVPLDLVAEMVLGFADLELCRRLEKETSEYRILRYRDDYRIFVNNPQFGERILKALTEILMDLGLKLNASKATGAEAVIGTSIKADKLEWMRSRQSDRDLQKHLLLIHCHSTNFPNAGSLLNALDLFYKRIDSRRTMKSAMQLISIAVDIGYHSPRCFPACAAIVSKLLSTLATRQEKTEALARVQLKLARLPNSGHLELWQQRISFPIDPKLEYVERLCRLVQGAAVDIWNNSWITTATLTAAADPRRIVNRSRLKKTRPVMPRAEFALFDTY